MPPPPEPPEAPSALPVWLAVAGLAVLALTLLFAALTFKADAYWLLAALGLGLGVAGFGLRELIARGERVAEPTLAPAPLPAPVAAPFDAPGTTAFNELKRELERYKEIERQLTGAKQEAEAAMMAKGEFLATMSHEIRTPLNGIIPLLDILLSTPLSADQRDYLVTAYQSAKQLLSIVDDILDFSKIEANKLELETVGINIKEIVDSVTRLMGKNAEAKGLKFGATIDPNVRLAMRGDSVRLRQVLTNLVSNAIKFTERGQIAIEVKKRGETRTTTELLFSVRDSGIGIPPEVQARLFKAFTQADASTTRIHGGTGLGLVICQRIVHLMAGQIGVKSEAGKGSTFWFSVPLLKAHGDMTPQRSDVHGSRAMLVTTDQALLRRVSGYFSTWGVNYVQTTVSAEALAKLRSAGSMGESWAYDFLVLDWGAMKNSALSLARNVLREAVLERLRIVAISGEEEMAPEFRGSPRIGVFGRQFTDIELRSGMQRLLEAEDATAAPVESLLSPLVPAPPEAEGAARATLAAAPSALAPTLQAAAAAASPAAAPLAGIGGHVLLVEDNAVNRQVAQRLLSLVGVSFEVAENGKEAVDKLEQGRFDAVLMDCQMPILDGYAATRTVRKLEADGARKGHIPIVAMTANAMAGDREKCLAAGMDDYMSKPLNRALLEQMLRKWLPATAASRPTAAAGTAARGPAGTAAPAVRLPPSHGPAAPGARAPAAYAENATRGTPAINQEIIQDLLEMMGNEFTDLVRVYLEDTPKSITALEHAAQAGDMEGLIAPAHSLKSTSANLGAMSLSEMAKRIEHGARLQQLPTAPVLLVAEISAEFRRVVAEFRRLLSTSPEAKA